VSRGGRRWRPDPSRAPVPRVDCAFMSMPPPSSRAAADEPKPRSVIGRKLAVGFGLVGVTTLVMCGTLLYLLAQVANSVRSMQHGEASVRQSLALAMAVREQYIHQAHTIVEGDHSHMKHYEQWLERVDQHATSLRSVLSPDEQQPLERVVAESAELDRLFKQEIVPAVDRQDLRRLRELHRRAESLSSRAVRDADAIAVSAERRMAGRHEEAIGAARFGLLVGCFCMTLVVLLSVLFTRRIRRSVVEPLDALVRAARRFGRGDLSGSIGPVGEGEFRAVAVACDRMLAELRTREAKLVQSERLAAIGQLAAGVAHEINNPIGVIRGYLKTMSPYDPPETLAEELGILDDEAQACQRIAEDLVAFARAEEGLTLADVDMADLLGEAVRRFAESGEAGGRAVESDLGKSTISADARRLRQVVLNLLRNAAQVSPEEEAIELTGTPQADGGYEFCVLDRGPGIPQADAARVFEPFFTKREGGSGLGLAVCQGILRVHGGEIRAEPRSGGGTVFRVRLPARPSGFEGGRL